MSSKLQLFRDLVKIRQDGDIWLDSVPGNIRTSFFDNNYVSAILNQLELVLSEIFTPEELDWVDYYFYEMGDDKTGTVAIDDVQHSFKGLDQYCNFLKDVMEWK